MGGGEREQVGDGQFAVGEAVEERDDCAELLGGCELLDLTQSDDEAQALSGAEQQRRCGRRQQTGVGGRSGGRQAAGRHERQADTRCAGAAGRRADVQPPTPGLDRVAGGE